MLVKNRRYWHLSRCLLRDRCEIPILRRTMFSQSPIAITYRNLSIRFISRKFSNHSLVFPPSKYNECNFIRKFIHSRPNLKLKTEAALAYVTTEVKHVVIIESLATKLFEGTIQELRMLWNFDFPISHVHWLRRIVIERETNFQLR